MLAVARQEYEDIVKNDVQKAISVDETAIQTFVQIILIMLRPILRKKKLEIDIQVNLKMQMKDL
jgi:serine protein kinase